MGADGDARRDGKGGGGGGVGREGRRLRGGVWLMDENWVAFS